MLQANAAGSADSEPAFFIATTPCRLVDTRPAPATVGPRAEPLVANSTYNVRVLGANGRCTIPDDATTLVMNVTAVNATASSFLTVHPTGSARPDTSSLNWAAGSDPIANAVTANVSASGELSFFNHAGSVNLIADVVGYYTSAPLDDYYTKAQVDALIAQNPGAVGPQGAQGESGVDGDDGATGPQGAPGIDGAAGTGMIAHFYAMSPPDNPATIAIGTAVPFPHDGWSTAGTAISRTSVDTFAVHVTGTYRVSFSVPIDEAGQLTLAVNGMELSTTTVGRYVGSSPIIGDSLVFLYVGDVVQVKNVSSASALTVTTLAGGTNPASSSLMIELVKAFVPL